MSVRLKTVAFAVEHKERELIYKCIAAKQIAEKGLKVYLGSSKALDFLFRHSDPTVALHKDPHSRGAGIQKRATKLCI